MSAAQWRKNYKTLIPWSEEQLNVFKTIEETKDNLLIEAVPGSGKSTTLIGITAVLGNKPKIQMLSFNKSIVEDLKQDPRLSSSNIVKSTAHSLALSNLKRAGVLPNQSWNTPDKNKYIHKIKEHLECIEEDLKLSIKATLNITNPEDESLVQSIYENIPRKLGNIVSLTQLNVYRNITPAIYDYIIYNHSIRIPVDNSYKQLFIDLINEVLDWGLEIAKEKDFLSYDDMLWLFNIERGRLRIPKKDVVLVDECQDLNKAMIGIIKAYVNNGARVVFVGDPNQAIQGFAGSDAYSWESIINIFNPIRLPLHKSFRCPQSHIELAKELVPHLEGANSNIGNIIYEGYQYIVDKVDTGHVVLARTKAQLVKLYLSLLHKDKACKIKDIDAVIGSLKLLLGYVFPLNGKIYLEEIYTRLDEVYTTVESKYREDPERLAFYEEAYNSIIYINKYIKDNELAEEDKVDYKEYIKIITNLLKNNCLEFTLLSTIHSYKGCENDNVWVLDYNALPIVPYTGVKWQIEQEINLLFVAITRSKNNLYLID